MTTLRSPGPRPAGDTGGPPALTPGSARVGVVGIGRMGANIARRLRERGYAIAAVADADRDRARHLAAELGAAAPDSLAALTAASDVILTVVTDDAAMRAIFARAGDSLLRDAAGKTFVNCATISPQVHVEVDALARTAGASAVEACMASSIPQAREGTLYLICGGDADAFERARPLLEAMSVSLRWVGGPGTAAQVKALVNMLMNINTAGLAEALGLGAALGLDLTALMDVFAHTGANSRVLETDGADMVAREHEVYFSAAHAAKDSGIALALGERAGLTLPLAAATLAQYERLVGAGCGELDKSAIAELTFPGTGTVIAEARRVVLESGATTTIECWGDAGPAILCVHGIGGSRRDFAPLGEALASTHRVFAYDQRGHGDAETAAPLSLGLLVADLRSVADSIGTVAAVVGDSWGGAVALAGGPKIARALVLVEPMVRVAPATFHADPDGWDLRERLAALKIPTAILVGRVDSVFALDDLARLSSTVRIETLDACGPSLHRDAFERFAEAVREAVPA